ncbi:hypothetical protein PAMC26510_06295 [Caballeronia sordidicola]|uniref:Uncharacterized protein n=2 Tax=Caballeronia sordidicola TaxID=196367 RepID=A0A242N5Y9_CABSO|nr:hypothetical protein PAMC26510_06295 [Caballeronia sordidicola]
MPSFLDVISATDKSVFEPHVPQLFKRSRSFFVNTVGMREAPERLVVELFRELCFDAVTPKGEKAARELLPRDELSLEEKALLYAARGRSKQTRRKQPEKAYFGPLYPALARDSWPRQQAERVVAYQLLDGPIAEYFGRSDTSRRAFSRDVINAMYGNTRSAGIESDIFKELLEKLHFDVPASGIRSSDDAYEKLVDRLSKVTNADGAVGSNDALAGRISEDFLSLCKLEGKVPRLFWFDLLKCFLRLCLPAWLLAQMRITVYLRDWTVAALAGDFTPDDVVTKAIAERSKSLFHPTQTGSNEISLHVERYVKARIELSLSAYLVRHVCGFDISRGTLSLKPGGKDVVSVSDWLKQCRDCGLAAGLPRDEKGVRATLVPWAQTFGAWLTPDRKGQGKNIIEFLRIFLRLADTDEDGGYLVTGTGRFEHGVVFPGPALLRTMLYLSAARLANGAGRPRGKLILSDLEQHFSEYGVDFGSSVGARPKLIAELARLGLLKGSPDAGDSAELLIPDAFIPAAS